MISNFVRLTLVVSVVSAGLLPHGPKQSSELFVLTGGNSYDGMESSIQLYPGESDCSVPPLNQPRRDHVVFSQGDLLVACGGTSRAAAQGARTSSECVSLDLGTGASAWVPHSTITSDKREYASFAVINDMNCIVGGRIEAKTTLECLDPATNFWVELPETIPGDGVYSSCSVNLPDGSVLFIGGHYDDSQIIQRTADGHWDASSWGQLLIGTSGHNCALDGTKVVVTGGKNLFGYTLKNTQIIDLETKEIVQGPALNFDRTQFSMAFVDGAVVVVGGFNDESKKLDSAERFNAATNEWEVLDYKTTKPIADAGSVVVSSDLLGCAL